ncbi:hypothetical protein QBC46DRAFT_167295 [Diplogelasinospora grovesii]|uniref:Uncharacterized protein n=1 Tax=Diplogelasinospora grovesii TaxID=303347 RepID=A0AAN6N4D9_9PEZI|nr:hypothetical protein QBC46DRAFT_167295 [Diplogelasinospora grovesii]
MERQSQQDTEQTTSTFEAYIDSAPTTPRSSISPSVSTSIPSLRFPKPLGNQDLANWVSRSSPDIMQHNSSLDPGGLSDSAYELINNTDTESQDGRLSESTGSLENLSRPDDVHSLGESESHYDTEDDDSDDDSDHPSRASSIRYADQVLQNPSTHLPTNSLRYGTPTSEASDTALRSIEFQEEGCDDPIYMDMISVKHTIREFTEEETAAIATEMGMSDIPGHLVATIRQTMSQAYLSTREPLRVLYVGCPRAQRDIVLKISNAIWASPKADARDDDLFGRHREGIYNIVPISSFGPTPELDLMEASHYQIKVEHCTSASEITYEAASFPGDTVYSITIEHDKTYRSLFSPSGSVIQPKWALPHIVIFYRGDDEHPDSEAEKTRAVAWEFMSRHGVPSIFISESQRFSKSPSGRWRDFVDQHAIHMCLESRDPETPIPPQRLPIDLESFTNIDSRQMNRNLAYLTGLAETSEEPESAEAELPEPSTIKTKSAREHIRSLKNFLDFDPSDLSGERSLEFFERYKWFLALIVPLLMALMAPIFALVLSGLPSIGTDPGSLHNIPRSPSSVTGAFSSLVCTGRPTPSTSDMPASTTTVIINVTSTRTVQISQAEAPTSALASVMSVAGLLSDRSSSAPVEPQAKNTVCSVRVHSPNELVVTIPSSSKSAWLSKGAIEIDVRRAEEPVKTKISLVDEGILVELKQQDAYGTLDVSVVTSRKPRINETFVVDFGKSAVGEMFEAGLQMLHGIAKRVSNTADGAAHLVEDTCSPAVAGLARLGADAASVVDHMRDAGKAAQSHCAETVDRVRDSLKSNHVVQFIKDTQQHVSQQIKSAERVCDHANLSLLKAQIASKLWWLKVQGKKDEYADYELRATQFLKLKHEEAYQAQQKRESGSLKGSESCSGSGKHRHCTEDDPSSSNKARKSLWKRIVG